MTLVNNLSDDLLQFRRGPLNELTAFVFGRLYLVVRIFFLLVKTSFLLAGQKSQIYWTDNSFTLAFPCVASSQHCLLQQCWP
jgi:hypothetical protein